MTASLHTEGTSLNKARPRQEKQGYWRRCVDPVQTSLETGPVGVGSESGRRAVRRVQPCSARDGRATVAS
jgi:hypothetical protein